MNRQRPDRATLILLLLLIIPVIWAAVLAAPLLAEGLPGLIKGLPGIDPANVTWTADTPRTILIFLLAYGMGLMIYYSTRRNYRRLEEHGSARWGDAAALCRKYRDRKSPNQNKLLTQNVSIGLNGRKHRRNLNTLVIGGSGAGKTRFFCKPNVMQANTSFVILDPKGEILRDTGYLLEKKGYVIKVLDLIDMGKSHGYNPFAYIRDENDVLKLVTNLIRNTTPKGSQSNDPFWERSETALLQALILYLVEEAPTEEQNFPMVMEMIAASGASEGEEAYESIIDELFARLAMEKPESVAVKQYGIYKQAPGKTAMSILISMAVRLSAFNLPRLASLTSHDELDLASLGEKKTALFAVLPDNDSSFNFLIGMLYTQLFQQLYYQADIVHGGRLPVHVHFVMDEFANVALPDEFDKLLSTMRSREISVSIIIQNLAQLKALFEKQWESIVGNCDEFLYLGGNEQSTHEYVSKLLGKETIDTNTYGQSRGHNGSYSTNWQLAGRELLTPDEVRMLDNKYALLFIRGERPVQDLKYDILRHPNVALTTDGKAKPYRHGEDTRSIASIIFDPDLLAQAVDYEVDASADNYELLSDEEMEDYFKKLQTTGGNEQ
mgnify:CR=1 FL=1